MNLTGIGWALALAGTALGLGQVAPPTGLRIVTPCGVMTPGGGPTLLRDDFNGSALDGTRWYVPTGKGTFIGRTQIRPPSESIAVANCVARLRVDTFNPTALEAGDSFWGSEIVSRQSFSRGPGLVFRARVRLAGGSVPGMVASFFSYVTRKNATGQDLHDKIDFELLTKNVGRNAVLTNVYNDDPVDTAGRPEYGTRAGLDLAAFNEYEVRWLPGRGAGNSLGDETSHRDVQASPPSRLAGRNISAKTAE